MVNCNNLFTPFKSITCQPPPKILTNFILSFALKIKDE